MRRAIIALSLGMLFFALSDILIWQRIFEAGQMWQFDSRYQAGHLAVLIGLIVVGTIALVDNIFDAAWYAVSFIILAYSGLADVLYYWLDGRAIPSQLPWLTNHPGIIHPVTNVTVVLSAVLWIAACLTPILIHRRFKYVETNGNMVSSRRSSSSTQ